MAHDFETSKAWSRAQSDAPWWEPVYRQAFPDFVNWTKLADGPSWWQDAGIDRALHFRTGVTYHVDEKVRAVDYGDICLEYWSNEEWKRPGWIAKPLACHFLAYAVVPIRTCRLYPMQALQRAWELNRDAWLKRFKTIRAPNNTANGGRYHSACLIVPTDVLAKAVSDALVVRWADNAATLSRQSPGNVGTGLPLWDATK